MHTSSNKQTILDFFSRFIWKTLLENSNYALCESKIGNWSKQQEKTEPSTISAVVKVSATENMVLWMKNIDVNLDKQFNIMSSKLKILLFLKTIFSLFCVFAWTFVNVWHRLHSYDIYVHHCAICDYFTSHIRSIFHFIRSNGLHFGSFHGIHFSIFFLCCCVCQRNSNAENENKTNNTSVLMLLHI